MTNLSPLRPARIVLLLEDLKFGGTQRQALELARGLDRRRFQPEIWVMAAGDDLAPLARARGIPLVRLSGRKKPGLPGLARLWVQLKKTPPDLLLCLTALPNIWGRLLGRLSGAPLVVGNVRGLLHGNQFERWLWPLADHILCNTHSIPVILNKDCKICASRLTVIPNGVDTDFFRPPEPSKTGQPIILSVARMVPEKDHETLIRAFRLVLRDQPDAQLWLVGDGPRKPAMEQLVKATLPPARVRFLAGRADLRPLLQQASLFVLSSRHEAFPNVVLEAMAMGLPVAATRVGGLPELVIPGETGWLTPPGNVPALAGAMAHLLADPETREAFGRAGRERVEREFTLKDMVRRHEEVFATLLAQKHRPKAAGKEPGVPLAPAPRPGALAGEFAGTSANLPCPGPPRYQPLSKTGPRVAYFLLWFPEPTQTFILDEVNTLFRLGLNLKVYTFYGPRPSHRVSGMGEVLVPVDRLGLASLGTLLLQLLRLFRDRRPLARLVLAETLVRGWRNWETAGEALWAALAGAYLSGVLAREGVDHIHAPWADGPATGAWVASRLSGIPFSFCGHAHDLYPPDGALTAKLQAAAFIRVISALNRDYLSALLPDAAAKIKVIRIGVPLSPHPQPQRTPRPPYQLLSIGRLVPKKGFPILIQACRELAAQGVDFHLTLAGDGPQRRELQDLVRQCGLTGRVHFPGFVLHRQVPALLQRADLFIMPSIVDPAGDRDGIPTVIMEAMAHEVPVVATDVSGIPEAVAPGQTGWLVPPGDPRALAAAIREALDNPAEARRRGQAGKRRVAEEFDSVKNYGKLKGLLEKYSGKQG
ncbi:MAG: glycosyltransferase [Thermodesulfobacteriota bacterium]